MATLVATYADSDGVNQNFLSVTAVTAGTTDEPELLVVKCVGGDNAMTVATPTGGGLTYTQQANYAPASSARVAVWTAKDTSSQSFTLSTTWAGSANAGHSMVVERWQFADVDPSTPVVVTANSTGSPTASLTTTAPDSAISWAVGDWNAVDGSGRVYDASTEVPAEELYHFVSGSYTAYHAYLYAPTVRSHTLGLTAPGAQKYTLVGIEILDVGGAERLDPLPQAMRFRPPGRVAPNGLWAPFTGRDSRPPRNTAPSYPSSAVLAEGTGTRSFAAQTTAAGDWLVVEVEAETDDANSGMTPSGGSLTYLLQNDTVQGTGTRGRVFQWAAFDRDGGSRTVQIAPAVGTVNYRGNLTVVRGSDGPGSHQVAKTAQQVLLARLDDHSGVFMSAVDFVTSGTLGTPTYTPGGSSISATDGSAADYAFGRWDDAGTQATGSHGVATPTLNTPSVAVLEMLGTTTASGATAITLPDSGTAADVVTAGVATPLLDTGAAADPVAVSAAVPLADSGAAADTVLVAIPITLADSGAGSDSLSVAVAMPLTDSGTAADTVAVAVQVPLADAGSGADSVLVSQLVSLLDSGAGSDQTTTAAQVPLPETGTGTDMAAVAAAISLLDSGSGADQVAVAAAVTLADSGSAADQVAVAVPKPLADSGAGADSAVIAAAVPLTDSGAAADGVAVAVAATLSDTGTGTDTVSVVQGAQVTLTDAGMGTDAVTVTAAVPLAEAGTAVDAAAVAAQVTLFDSAAAADSVLAGQQVNLADSGAGSDTIRATAAISLGDAGSAADQVAAQAQVPLADAGAGQDAVAVGQAKTLADAGAAADSVRLAAAATLVDLGTAADAASLAVLLTLGEAGIGTDDLTTAGPPSIFPPTVTLLAPTLGTVRLAVPVPAVVTLTRPAGPAVVTLPMPWDS